MICHKCKKDIDGYENACSAMGYYFHVECLCCLKCGKNLHGGEFIVMGTDDPYCHDCYENVSFHLTLSDSLSDTRQISVTGEVLRVQWSHQDAHFTRGWKNLSSRMLQVRQLPGTDYSCWLIWFLTLVLVWFRWRPLHPGLGQSPLLHFMLPRVSVVFPSDRSTQYPL